MLIYHADDRNEKFFNCYAIYNTVYYIITMYMCVCGCVYIYNPKCYCDFLSGQGEAHPLRAWEGGSDGGKE